MRSERLDKSCWSTTVASSSAAAAQKIPSWATLVTPHRSIRATIGKEPLGRHHEESYLRTVCYHAARRFIEQTQDHSMTSLLDPFHAELSRLLRQVAPAPPTQQRQHPPSAEPASAAPTSAAKRRRISKSDDDDGDDDTPVVANTAKNNNPDSTSHQWCCRVVQPTCSDHRQQCYDPLLLPVLLLDGPHYALDRHAWMRHIVVSTRVRRARTCVVWLTFQTTTDTDENNNIHTAAAAAASSFMGKKTIQRQPGGTLHYCCREITRQCLRQDPDCLLSKKTGKSILLAKKKKKKHQQHPSMTMMMTSLTDMLVTWASRTTKYDEIVVCVDVTAADMSLNGAEVQDLLHWTAERRALHGLPLAVTLLGPHSGKPPLELRSSAQGPVGVLVRRFVLPSATTLLDTFWTTLMKLGDTQQQQSASSSAASFPIHFATAFMDAVEQTYWQQNGSAIEIIIQLKQYLAHCFARRGSAMLLYDTPLLPRQEQCRLTWFLLDKQARQLITTPTDDDNDDPSYADTIETLQDLQTARAKAQVAMQVRKHIGEQIRRQHQEAPLLFTYSLRRLQQSSDIPLEKQHATNLVSFLAQLRARTVNDDPSDDNDNDALMTIPGKKIDSAMVEEAVVQYINELIVLTAHCAHVSELESITQLTINDWGDHVNRLVKGNAAATTAASVAAVKVQPRRQIIRGLLSQQQNSSTPVDAAGQLYRLLQDRVSIAQEEWIALFRESSFVTGLADSSTQEILALFVYGIHHLMFQGLIREKRAHSSRADPVYEKTVLVWCTGD